MVRTRPYFENWSAAIELSYLEEIVNPADLTSAVRAAGMLVGIRRLASSPWSVRASVGSAAGSGGIASTAVVSEVERTLRTSSLSTRTAWSGLGGKRLGMAR